MEFTDDVEAAARRHADGYAFTIGAMGSREQNFYNDALTRQGFGDDVAGRAGAVAVRPPRRGRRPGPGRARAGRPTCSAPRPWWPTGSASTATPGIGTLQAKLDGDHATRLDTLAQLVDLVRQINPESSAVTQ